MPEPFRLPDSVPDEALGLTAAVARHAFVASDELARRQASVAAWEARPAGATLQHMTDAERNAALIAAGLPQRDFWRRLKDGDLRLSICIDAARRTWRTLGRHEFDGLTKEERAQLARGCGSVRGEQFFFVRVRDLIGLPPAEAAEAYTPPPVLTEDECLSVMFPNYRRPGTLPAHVIEARIARDRMAALEDALRAGRLLASGDRGKGPEQISPLACSLATDDVAASRIGPFANVRIRLPEPPLPPAPTPHHLPLPVPAPPKPGCGGRPESYEWARMKPELATWLAANRRASAQARDKEATAIAKRIFGNDWKEPRRWAEKVLKITRQIEADRTKITGKPHNHD